MQHVEDGIYHIKVLCVLKVTEAVTGLVLRPGWAVVRAAVFPTSLV